MLYGRGSDLNQILQNLLPSKFNIIPSRAFCGRKLIRPSKSCQFPLIRNRKNSDKICGKWEIPQADSVKNQRELATFLQAGEHCSPRKPVLHTTALCTWLTSALIMQVMKATLELLHPQMNQNHVHASH